MTSTGRHFIWFCKSNETAALWTQGKDNVRAACEFKQLRPATEKHTHMRTEATIRAETKIGPLVSLFSFDCYYI